MIQVVDQWDYTSNAPENTWSQVSGHSCIGKGCFKVVLEAVIVSEDFNECLHLRHECICKWDGVSSHDIEMVYEKELEKNGTASALTWDVRVTIGGNAMALEVEPLVQCHFVTSSEVAGIYQ